MRKTKIQKLQAAALIAAFCMFVIPGGSLQVRAQTTSSSGMTKLSKPLQQVVLGQITDSNSWYEANATQPFVQVLVQTYSSDLAGVRQAIKAAGGTVWTRYYSINGVDAWIPVARLLEIAQRSDVERMTPNYLTQQTESKLEKATGAAATRVLDALTNDYVGPDGSGIGIAVLDSGIMAGNKGFNDANGVSRVKAQTDIVQLNTALRAFKNSQYRDRIPYAGKDFADLYYGAISSAGVSPILRNWQANGDVYGHGTFVAGVAAGRGKRGKRFVGFYRDRPELEYCFGQGA
ncbi:MAG: S8 family serine peptidase [Acidobacteria bacterium]|nr:S8 family serine peptidase [Acidobacteriota bacterium]